MMERPLILYFGSFNPVHAGHIAVAEAALRYFGGKADLWFMLSARNPFKTEADLWPDERRWALLNEALAGRTDMRACDLELQLPRPSYTVFTLERVRAREGAARPLYLLMGEDNLAKFTAWRSFETILEWCRVIVYPRGAVGTMPDAATGTGPEAVPQLPAALAAYADRFILLRGTLHPQSSTAIRARAAADPTALTPAVAAPALPASPVVAAETADLIGHTPADWARCLSWRGQEAEALRAAARKVKEQTVGRQVYLRGLIEYSNICRKNCYYCGIRAGNPAVARYTVEEQEVLAAVENAYRAGFGSIVLQSGERQDEAFVQTIERLLKAAVRLSEGRLGITLSLGEQTLETYKRWREAGATRYLLRIETSNPALYARLHPADHRFADRLKALEALKAAGYQVGSGVMIGLPGQTTSDLAADLAFFRDFGIDMVGMGPYIEHHETPLYARRHEIPSLAERYELSLNMLALLRLIMPTVNIAATTAMASLHPQGREEALRIAANVIMPNITPLRYRENYFLYENKLCICESEQDAKDRIEALVRAAGGEIRYFEKGDPQHYFIRIKNNNDMKKTASVRKSAVRFLAGLLYLGAGAAVQPALRAQTLGQTELQTLQRSFEKDAPTRAIQNVLTQDANIKANALNRERQGKIDHFFKYRVDVKGITDQKRSGRCWMFTSLNILRPQIMKQYNIDAFDFSHNYLYFWDMLEKSNLFLENMIRTAGRDRDDREVVTFFQNPVNDGGVWNLYYNLASKYGVVPAEVMPETEHANNTSQMVSLVNERLRKGGMEIRKAAQATAQAGQPDEAALRTLKMETLKDVYRILSLCLGEPPAQFTWRYKTKDGEIKALENYTPMRFYQEVVPADFTPDNYVMIMHDPTRPYYQVYDIANYRNTYEGLNWVYLNLPLDDIKKAALASIKANEPMYTSSDVGKQFQADAGLLDPALYDYNSLMGVDFGMDKKDRILSRQSGSAHAMMLMGCDTDDKDRPVKWEFENSWGANSGHNGYLTFTDDWFNEYMFRFVINKKYLDSKALKALKTTPVALPVWDYMF